MNTISLADIFVGLGRRYVNRPALVSGSRSLSFEGLVAESARVAHALAAEGIEPGHNVGLALRNGVEMMVYLLALWMLDAVAVPLEFRSRVEQREELARDFDLVLVVADSATPGAAYPGIALDSEWHEIVARQSALPPQLSRTTTPHTAMIALTSGTTGKPLGQLMEHSEILLRSIQQRAAGFYFPDGRHFNAAPLSFSASRTQTIARLCEGCTVYFYPAMFSPEEFVEALNAVEATFTFLVPTVVRSLVDYARTRPAPLFPTLQALQSGGSSSRAEEKREARDLLTPNYAEIYATSLAGQITVLRGSEIDTHGDSVGRVLAPVRLEIVDERDRLLAAGQEGIIRLRSPAMISATYKGQQRAAGDRLKDGWVYPGDLGSVDAEGYLRILGRTSEVIIRGGANVHPSEIESVLGAHSGVRDVAVVGYAAEREGEDIAAFLVTDGSVSEPDLVALCRVRLPPDKRPRRFVFLEALPLNTNGKVIKDELKAMLIAP